MCTVSQTDKQCCWVSFDFLHRTDFSGFSVACFKSRFKVKRGMQFVECLLRTDAGPSSARSLALLGPSTVSPAVPAGSEWKNEGQKFKASPDGRRPVLNRNKQKMLDVVAQACNSSPWKTEAGGSGVHDPQ